MPTDLLYRALMVALLLCSALTAHADDDAFTYTSPSGFIFTVTEDGLSHITRNGQTIASGQWTAQDAGHLYRLNDKPTNPRTTSTLVPVNDHTVTVQHQHERFGFATTYTFTGDDVHLAMHLVHTLDRGATRIARFGGLTFHFNGPPSGYMITRHPTYTQAHGVTIMHPSPHNPGTRWGAGYAHDDTFGIGANPHDTAEHRTRLNWDYDWAEDQRKNTPWRKLHYDVATHLSAGSEGHYAITLRLSTQTDWRHLQQPYKDHLHKTLAQTPQYDRPDHRPWIMSVVNKNVESISPANPFGLHDGRRIDTHDGLLKYGRANLQALQRINGQGLMIWGQTGSHPRGAMYRPDFDVIPDPIAELLPTLGTAMQQAGYTLGLAARPGEYIDTTDPEEDKARPIPLKQTIMIDQVVDRFLVCRDQYHAQAFYLDSFGAHYDHLSMMKTYREALGPSVQTYAEHACDIMAPYTGFYVHMRSFDDFIGASPRTLEMIRWLYPDTPIFVRTKPGYPMLKPDPKTGQTPLQYLLQRKLTPLITDYQLWTDPQAAENVGTLVRRYLDDQGQWRDPPAMP